MKFIKITSLICFFVMLGCKQSPPPRKSQTNNMSSGTKVINSDDSKIVKQGSVVSLDFIASFDDGKVFDKSKPEQPLELEIGSDKMTKAFQNNLVGMKMHDIREFTIMAADAYGIWDPNKVGDMPKANFPPDYDIKINKILKMASKDGRQLRGRIIEINEETVKVDLNHPLSGKNLHYKVQIRDIN